MTHREFSIRPLVPADRERVRQKMIEEWEAEFVIVHGESFQPARLPGFIAEHNGETIGLLTYQIEGKSCEIVTLNSWHEGIGVGTALIEVVRQTAGRAGCGRLFLVTTNNNLHALRFYQKRGFVISVVRINTIAESRKLKPEIPLIDEDGLPIRDEIELERNLDKSMWRNEKMAMNREGKKTVLLVVDVQVGVMQHAWDSPRIIKNIVCAVEKARRQGTPVIWVQHADEELVNNSPDWQLVPELVPAEGEMQVYKQFNSSFEQTPLEETLSRLEATHIVLAGAATNWCIRATAYGALDRGYDLTLIKDAHTTATIELENGLKIEAENIVRELNIAMNWLSYPGRKNGTASTEEVDFAA